MILFSAGGRADVLQRKKIAHIHSTACFGDGALRILGLLRSEGDCPPDVPWSPANVEWITRSVLKERELMAQLAERRFCEHPDLVPLPLRRKKYQGKWRYEYSPEVFGDFLCESAQLLIALLTQGSAKHRTRPWEEYSEWPPSLVPSGPRKRQRVQ